MYFKGFLSTILCTVSVLGCGRYDNQHPQADDETANIQDLALASRSQSLPPKLRQRPGSTLATKPEFLEDQEFLTKRLAAKKSKLYDDMLSARLEQDRKARQQAEAVLDSWRTSTHQAKVQREIPRVERRLRKFGRLLGF